MAEAQKSLRAIFDEASEMADAKQRRAFVARACGANAALRAEVEQLLGAHEIAGGFLGDPARGGLSAATNSSECVGDRIGRYKLLQKIGEGGCGVVYMAEQQEPVRRRVALKIIKLGMDTRSVIARFEAERQALALMDHPNIARVLDAGATEAGRPFFVMELVRGVKITDYCDQNSLSTTERLQLFTQVCQAVQHAHQKGIIHRDLKPSNILVTSNDGVPLPKVIDFGIAKATSDQRLTDKTLFTRFDMFIGTPAYMSPEQAEFNASDVDTRTDIYALGVLLYELLTGRTPFDSDTLLKSGLDAMRKAIRETEPTRPSTKLHTLAAAELSEVAKRRQAEPPKLVALVRGDLDWIVLKALEKDRTRRYDTANSFGLDVQRHLRNEPVTARPPSPLYVFQKMVRRNQLSFIAGAAVIGLLIAGVVVSTWQAVRAGRAERTQRLLREEAVSARVQADAANARLKRELFIREWHDAETLLEQGKTAPALAWFARAARRHPDDVAVVNRLVSALGEHDFAMPLHRPFVHGAAVNSAVFSGDGRRLITAASDGLVRMWPLGEPGEPLVLSNRFRSPLVGFVPRDNRLLVVDTDSLSLWDLNGARVKHRSVQHAARPRLAMTPDGQFAALGCGEGGPQLWDAAELRPVGRPAADVDDSFRIAGVSSDGRYLFGQHHEDFLSAWEVASGRRIWQAPPPGALWKQRVGSVAVHPDGSRVAISHPSGYFSVWRFSPARGGPDAVVADAEPVQRLQFSSTVTATAFGGPAQRLSLAAADGLLQLDNLDASDVSPVFIEHDGRVISLQYSPDGQSLATASVDGTARVWDVRMSRPKPRTFTNGVSVWDAKFSPDGAWFVMGGRPAAEIRDTTSGALRHRLEMTHIIAHLDVSSDGRRVVASSEAGEVRVWDAATGAPVTPMLRFPHSIQQVEFSPDGRRFVAAAPRETVWVYETETGALAAPPMTNNARVVSAHFSPDQRSLVVATFEGQIAFWSLPEGTRRGEPLRHKDLAWTMRFSPDGKFLLTASGDRTAALWDLGTGRLAREFHHDKPVYQAAFSPDGKRILTGSAANEARVWEAATGRLLFEPMRHPGAVWHGEYSADGRIILTGDDAGNARLWDAASGLPLGEWLRNGRSLKRTHFSPDGRRVLSAAEDGTVRLWSVALAPSPAPPWLPELAEAVAGRRLQEDGVIEPVAPERWQTLGAELAARTGQDFYTRWAHWFRIERMKENPEAFER